MRSRPRTRGSGAGAFIWLAVGAAVAIVGGGGLYLVEFPAPGWAPAWWKALQAGLPRSDTAQGDVASAPQPRATAVPAAGTAPDSGGQLDEMPPLAENGAATDSPEHWPALSPSELIDQGNATPGSELAEGASDQPPWRRFARPFAAPAGKPPLAILVTGLGNNYAVTAAAITRLPAEVTLSFSVSAPELDGWIDAARAYGHEAMVGIPMESKQFAVRDPGAFGLLVALSESEIDRRIDALAESTDHIFGFASEGGDVLLADQPAASAALREIAHLGLAFIDTTGLPTSVSQVAATATGVPFARSAMALDGTNTSTAIAERLAVAADLAAKQGGALAVTGGSAEAIVAVADFARGVGDRGPVLAPASALLKK